MIKVGDKAPEFSLPDQDGKTHALNDYLGKWVLLYFYPKDDTPGCTTEGETLRDAFSDFEKLNAVIFGVSIDSIESHKKFSEKFKFPFNILSDESKEVVEKYGVWGEKNFMGKKYMGTLSDSFLIDPKGNIVKIYRKVKPAEHAKEVLHDIEELEL